MNIFTSDITITIHCDTDVVTELTVPVQFYRSKYPGYGDVQLYEFFKADYRKFVKLLNKSRKITYINRAFPFSDLCIDARKVVYMTYGYKDCSVKEEPQEDVLKNTAYKISCYLDRLVAKEEAKEEAKKSKTKKTLLENNN